MSRINLFSNSKKYSDNKLGTVLISPVIIYLLVIMVIPFAWAIYTSFTNKMVGTPGQFVGLKNYINLIKNDLFWKSVVNTLIFTIFAVVLKVIFGTIMALVLNEDIKFRNVFRALLFLPWTIPTLISVFTWQWMFSDIGGVLNYVLLKMNLISEPIGWLATRQAAMSSVITINVWRGIPFLGIAILAGLQTISKDMYEAATIDGANVIKRFIYITIPSIKVIIILAALVTTIWTLNDFEIIWLLTRGGPSNGTQVISTLSYTLGFLNLKLGEAITVSIISFPPLIALVYYITKKLLVSEE